MSAKVNAGRAMKKVKDLDKRDRPREKLQAKGPAALSDFELLQALIGRGNAQRFRFSQFIKLLIF
jgi:DNA repair protein RadC